MVKKYAFMIMGGEYDPAVHQARFATDRGETHIRTVRDFAGAKTMAVSLRDEGVGAIELCGAFTPENARELVDITGGDVAVGYVIHDPAQDGLFAKFFG